MQASASDATLAETLENIAGLLQGKKKADAASGLAAFIALRDKAGLTQEWRPGNDDDIALLAGSVNVQRLSNFPLALNEADLAMMYRQILGCAS